MNEYLCQNQHMNVNVNELLTVSFTLFAVIDIIGSVPVLISLKQKIGHINEWKATLISGALMIVFLYVGEKFLNILGLDKKSFAVGGSIVIFILGLEMVLGLEFFKSEKDAKASTVVPIAFPLIAGSGTLTTIMSLKAVYEETTVLVAILLNLVIAESLSEAHSEALSAELSESHSEAHSEALSEELSEAHSESLSEELSESHSESPGEALSESPSESHSEAHSESPSESH